MTEKTAGTARRPELAGRPAGAGAAAEFEQAGDILVVGFKTTVHGSTVSSGGDRGCLASGTELREPARGTRAAGHGGVR